MIWWFVFSEARKNLSRSDMIRSNFLILLLFFLIHCCPIRKLRFSHHQSSSALWWSPSSFISFLLSFYLFFFCQPPACGCIDVLISYSVTSFISFFIFVTSIVFVLFDILDQHVSFPLPLPRYPTPLALAIRLFHFPEEKRILSSSWKRWNSIENIHAALMMELIVDSNCKEKRQNGCREEGMEGRGNAMAGGGR